MGKATTPFNQQCYELLLKIPQGKVTTYREMAKAMQTRAWRAIGNAMAKNPNLVSVPCHRVVRSNGEIGGYALGARRKAELLAAEGVTVSDYRIDNLDEVMHRF